MLRGAAVCAGERYCAEASSTNASASAQANVSACLEVRRDLTFHLAKSQDRHAFRRDLDVHSAGAILQVRRQMVAAGLDLVELKEAVLARARVQHFSALAVFD